MSKLSPTQRVQARRIIALREELDQEQRGLADLRREKALRLQEFNFALTRLQARVNSHKGHGGLFDVPGAAETVDQQLADLTTQVNELKRVVADLDKRIESLNPDLAVARSVCKRLLSVMGVDDDLQPLPMSIPGITAGIARANAGNPTGQVIERAAVERASGNAAFNADWPRAREF
jgi:hypothetical protein